ncbi:MAG TPA: hypothetical protein DCF89_05895 [Flavobacteriales bacterium]|jgi:hypothetical protein|nr:hypothetical protein [Crocinitomicaceae bacterium]HAE30628.1 hypothetical protein [Flavobacteriales bacterium]|tara:strand:+ start:653 stop:1021 length:369 start_codon:yes stop_codon:yes gene_type:complete
MRLTLAILAAAFLVFNSCDKKDESSYQATIWLGTYEALDTGADSEFDEKEIQGKLDILKLIAENSFEGCKGFTIENRESTSTFEIKVSDPDTVKVKEALNAYLDIIEGGYEVRVIEETHPVE